MIAAITLVLELVALLSFLLAALEVKGHRFNLIGAGLFLWLLATLVGGR